MPKIKQGEIPVAMPTREERDRAFTDLTRGYMQIIGNREFVKRLTEMRQKGLDSDDPKAYAPRVLALVDASNNLAADIFDEITEALWADDYVHVQQAILKLCQQFLEENFALAVRFEMEEIQEGMLGCLNNARGWLLITQVLRYGMGSTVFQVSEKLAQLRLMVAAFSNTRMADFAGFERIPIPNFTD